jgi:hypothetical protein
MTQEIIGFERENMEIIDLYVKRVFTTTTKTYLINANASLKEIMMQILHNAHEIFGYESGTQLELVEAGQSIEGMHSEDALAIELDSPDDTFKQHFENKYKHIAFYIRKVEI